MAEEILVPQLGESVIEATVGKWLKQVGDHVDAGEALVELETDKVNLEVTAEHSGVLQSIVKDAGSVVGVGEALGHLTVSDGVTAAVPTEPATAVASGSSMTSAGNGAHAQPAASPDAAVPAARPRVTPVAGRIAAEEAVDLSQVTPSGPGGRITKQDLTSYRERPVPAAAEQPAPSAPIRPVVPAPLLVPAEPRDREQRVRMSRRRLTIARRLVEAQRTAAMLTTFNEVDMSAIMEVRKRRKDSFKERHGVGLGFMSFFTKAAVGALKAFPRLNAEIQGEEIVLKSYYDIGIAVGAEEGLVVPVLRDADRKSFAEIEREIGDLAGRARGNTLSLADLQGGTFTITNGGVFGSLLSTPILNTPQVGILGMHKIQERPVVVAGQVAVRPMMYLALSYDHRIVDGSEAVRFLVRIKELLEDPETLLLEG